jgi:hypothetical protein
MKNKNLPSDMTVDQSPMLVNQVTRTVSDIVKEKNTNLSINFSWHNHFQNHDKDKEIKKPDEVKQIQDDPLRVLIEEAIEDGMDIKTFVKICETRFINIAFEKNQNTPDVARMVGIAYDYFRVYMRNLEQKGYHIEKPSWYVAKRRK